MNLPSLSGEPANNSGNKVACWLAGDRFDQLNRSITRKLARMMGGDVTVTSVLGKDRSRSQGAPTGSD